MFPPSRSNRKGTITLILIGLVSVMILFAFSLSRRLRGHTQLLTLGDYTQIARYFLESYVGDVMRQVQIEAYKKDSSVFKVFLEQAASGASIDNSVWKESTLLKTLRENLGIEYDKRPEIKLSEIKLLPFPSSINPAGPNIQKREKRGLLSITASVKFQKRRFTLEVHYPFSVVFRLTPILKNFVFFADRIDSEQKPPHFGAQDLLNLMVTVDGKHPLDVPTQFRNNLPQTLARQRPWLFYPPFNDADLADKEKIGKVYLGRDDKPIYLNLAGDKEAQGWMSDVAFQVAPDWFSVIDDNSAKDVKFEPEEFFVADDGTAIRLRQMRVILQRGPMGDASEEVRMSVFGYCSELIDPSVSIFKGTNWTLDDFTGKDQAYKDVKTQKENLALASSLKFLGKNYGAAGKDYYGFPREIYGKVLGRFLLLSFYWYTSAEGGGSALEFDSSPNLGRPYYTTFDSGHQDPRYFQPAPGMQYKDYMSRIVSGGADFSGGEIPRHYFPYNPVDPKGTSGRASRQELKARDFRSPDGFLVSDRFDSLLESWFKIERDKNVEDPSVKGVQARIGRFFPSGAAFKAFALRKPGEFLVDGVVWVEGKLKLSDLTLPTEKIRGGIVLVNGPIELGNITHGFNFKNNMAESDLGDVYKAAREIKPENILTFVSLTAPVPGVLPKFDPSITLLGTHYLGVQLVVHDPRVSNPTDQISWKGKGDIIFAGSLVMNTPNVKNRIREFVTACQGPEDVFPAFFYAPEMAEKDPAVAVQVMHHMRGYRLTAGLSGE